MTAPNNPSLTNIDISRPERLKEYLLAAKTIKIAMDQSRTGDHGMLKYVAYRQFMEKYQAVAALVSKAVRMTLPISFCDMRKVKYPFQLTGVQQKEVFEAVYINVGLLISFLELTIGMKGDETQSLRDFFQANLRRAVFNTPTTEREIQDTVEQLLIGRGLVKGVDYDRETGRIKVSIKEVVPDFIMPRLSLAIEVKLSPTKKKSKTIVDEINADIQSYGKKYASMLFIIYDRGAIQDESEFKHGIETKDGYIQVVIIKH